MSIDFLIKTFQDNKRKDAIVWKDKVYSYSFLLDKIQYYQKFLDDNLVSPGTVVILEGQFSPNTVALFLALIQRNVILVPITPEAGVQKNEWIEIAQGEISFSIKDDDRVEITRHPQKATHELFDTLRTSKHPGLVLFSSGTTGKSKAVVHDLTTLLERFKKPRKPSRTIAFLLFDHMGGIDTLFHIISNAGCIITCRDRSPDGVSQAIEKFQAELLPTSPTFINLMLLSESYKRYDLGSLKAVTYGTEPMPESTLSRFNKIFPHIKMLQTYGMSEVGVLKSKSKDSGSLWVTIGGDGVETRVVDGILQVKTASALLGYLNAPNPITEDGWFVTGDSVIVDGPYMKILGRKSDIINVGGEKVYPAEVESVIQEIDNVAESTVYGEKNPVLGNIVCSRVRLWREEDPKTVARRIKKYCGEKLQNYKVPMKIIFNQENQHSSRFKKKPVLKDNAR
jgi:long-chain acyl-CoA synthetase